MPTIEDYIDLRQKGAHIQEQAKFSMMQGKKIELLANELVSAKAGREKPKKEDEEEDKKPEKKGMNSRLKRAMVMMLRKKKDNLKRDTQGAPVAKLSLKLAPQPLVPEVGMVSVTPADMVSKGIMDL